MNPALTSTFLIFQRRHPSQKTGSRILCCLDPSTCACLPVSAWTCRRLWCAVRGRRAVSIARMAVACWGYEPRGWWIGDAGN